jgi:uncharacterized phage-associated protein
MALVKNKRGNPMSAGYSAFDIANYFLWKAQEDDQELLSNMKLQKLVYYAQGLHLSLNGTPLFKERIEAWTYGPVVVSLYHDYKIHGQRGIPPLGDFNPLTIDEDTREFLDEIFETLGQFSAVRLMEITHDDQCWKDAKEAGDAGDDNMITPESMEECLKKYLKNG